MYKKLPLWGAVAIVVFVSSRAPADTYGFEDIVDTWGVLGFEVDAQPILEGHRLTYQHDVMDQVDFGAGHHVLDAVLELDFTNDSWEGDRRGSWGSFRWDLREYVTVAYEGSGWIEIGEQNDGPYDLVLDIGWLNDDGLLDVTIATHNPLGTATLWLDHSRLYGTASTSPLPGAALLGAVGLAAAVRKLRRMS